MAKKKDPNQKGSGAKKHGRNYRTPLVGRFSTQGSMTRYRARHGIPAGRRKELHRDGKCPLHRREHGNS